jgi:hypothetical protein
MLTRLADASLDVEAAEAALADGAHRTAADALDRAAASLDDLREAWPGMSAATRAVVGAPAGDLRRRIDEARRRLPRRSALSVGTAVSDPEEDEEPRY